MSLITFNIPIYDKHKLEELEDIYLKPLIEFDVDKAIEYINNNIDGFSNKYVELIMESFKDKELEHIKKVSRDSYMLIQDIISNSKLDDSYKSRLR